jgi:hypothetical protein
MLGLLFLETIQPRTDMWPPLIRGHTASHCCLASSSQKPYSFAELCGLLFLEVMQPGTSVWTPIPRGRTASNIGVVFSQAIQPGTSVWPVLLEGHTASQRCVASSSLRPHSLAQCVTSYSERPNHLAQLQSILFLEAIWSRIVAWPPRRRDHIL